MVGVVEGYIYLAPSYDGVTNWRSSGASAIECSLVAYVSWYVTHGLTEYIYLQSVFDSLLHVVTHDFKTKD